MDSARSAQAEGPGSRERQIEETARGAVAGDRRIEGDRRKKW